MEEFEDEWTADIKELEQEIERQEMVDKVLFRTKKLMTNGCFEAAKNELIILKKGITDDETKNEIDYLFDLMRLKVVPSLILSIPLIIIIFAFWSFLFDLVINLKFMIPKWFPSYHETPQQQESWAEFLSELSVILVIGPAYAIGVARKKYPTLLKPTVPWKFSVPLSILLAILLATIHDIIYVSEFMALHSYPLSFKKIMEEYYIYKNVNSFIFASLHSFFGHILMSIGMIGTILISYYGKLSKESSEGIELLNEVSGELH